MKITCENCHKKFDNEKYYGICPKCGAFNRLHVSEEEHMSYHNMYDGSDTHSEYEKHEKFHEMYDNTTAHTKVSTGAYDENGKKVSKTGQKKGRVFSIVFIIFWFLFFGFIMDFISGIIHFFYNFNRW